MVPCGVERNSFRSTDWLSVRRSRRPPCQLTSALSPTVESNPIAVPNVGEKDRSDGILPLGESTPLAKGTTHTLISGRVPRTTTGCVAPHSCP